VRTVTEALLELLQAGEAGALATVIKTQGSTPQRAGARLLLRQDGRLVGTIGGGAIEQHVVEALRALLERGGSSVLQQDLGRDLGMCCGGRMEIFVEAIQAVPRLWIFGAGHVAQPTARLARSVGFELCVIDEREDQNTPERFPQCRLELAEPAAFLRRTLADPARLGRRDWLLIVTHDHRLDEDTLALALTSSARYIGLVGSKRKVFRLVQRVAARQGGLDLTRVYAPVGLDLGAVTPEEIAVSIVGELLALRHRRGANHMRAVDDERLEPFLDDDAPEDEELGVGAPAQRLAEARPRRDFTPGGAGVCSRPPKQS
jgi:xanthine dehydrogenase accessory factor